MRKFINFVSDNREILTVYTAIILCGIAAVGTAVVRFL